ncbi:MAG: AAA family ATPase [Candidatus Thermoplasmatota archaeon]|nr:AAA family ATPase [Euryarchaeota archaeon]MBU4032826.1 AAA family ATPase [Candidatus Thermoplasmatota archaeon]MBU4071551.1 AAA family ATPase [Candidatus Thermoplasmatota archaeon]MBU4144489.1 AAA family ATPase [Candidatus Thermoplasmatota archaeon]MBU4592717.1 AAA family ATPase [Candidatus Thermoplasmatota archaeon]
MSDERIRTFIKGLDENMEGGIPKGFVVLLTGMPGSMKSSVGFNILYQNAKQNNSKGVYFTLEQGRESLLEQMDRLHMPVKDMESMISVVDIGYLRQNTEGMEYGDSWNSVFRMYAENMKESQGYDIMVIDSLAALEVLADVKNKRAELFHLFGWLRGIGCKPGENEPPKVTTFIISEASTNQDIMRDEDFLADGVIHLDLRRESDNVNLYLGVAKMRKTNHSRKYCPLIFDQNGFEVNTD